MRAVSTKSIRMAVLAPALLLGGCISLGGVEPPPSLLTLTAQSTAPSGEATAVTGANAISILAPEVPAKLDVLRVPVQVSPTEIAYLQDAFWVEKPTRLFRRLLGETLRAKGGMLVLDNDDTPLVADRTLRGTLSEFGYDAASSSVIVQFDAIRSIAIGEGDEASEAIETRRFEAIVPGVLPEATDVGPALNQAANQVAADVADWLSE